MQYMDDTGSSHRSASTGVDRLAEQLLNISVRYSGMSVHLLVQPSERPSDLDAEFAQMLDEHGLHPVPVRIGRVPESLWPMLVTLDCTRSHASLVSGCALAMALVDRSPSALRQGSVQRSCAWLFSAAEAASLAASIAACSVVTTATAPHHHWVRYYDPMVIDLFWQACGVPGRKRILEKIAAWAFVDRRGALEVLTSPAGIDGLDERHSHPDLNGIGPLNQAWIRACIEARVVEPSEFAAALSTVQRGWKAGIRDRLDLDLFAWHAITVGADFDRHPMLQEMLRKVAAGEAYADLAHALDPPDWHRIEQESRGVPAPGSPQERATL